MRCPQIMWHVLLRDPSDTKFNCVRFFKSCLKSLTSNRYTLIAGWVYNFYKVYLMEEEQEALRYCGELTIYPYPEHENVCNKLFVKDAFYHEPYK